MLPGGGPSGAHPKYFSNYIDRINGAGWRPGTAFPGGVILRSVDLSRVELVGKFMIQCDLASANLSSGHFTATHFFGSRLDNADVRNATLLLTGFEGTTINGADFTNARFDLDLGFFSWPSSLLEPRGVESAIGFKSKRVRVGSPKSSPLLEELQWGEPSAPAQDGAHTGPGEDKSGE